MARRFLPEFDKGAHSVYLEYFHLVCVTKYRRAVLNETIHRRICEIFDRVARHYEIIREQFGGEADHIHVLFTAPPKTRISDFIRSFKSATSRLIKQEFPAARPQEKGAAFWSPSYCLLTTGGAPIDIVKRYIENQGKGSAK